MKPQWGLNQVRSLGSFLKGLTRAPRSRRPPLSRGVSPAPSAPRGFRPASSTRRRWPSRALDRTRDVPDRNGTSPGPNRSQPLTSSPPPVSSRCPGTARMLGRAAAAAAQAPPTPRHSHRIATARAAWGPGSERGAPRRRCFRAPERAGALGDPRAASGAPTDCDSGASLQGALILIDQIRKLRLRKVERRKENHLLLVECFSASEIKVPVGARIERAGYKVITGDGMGSRSGQHCIHYTWYSEA
ncbi:hypothetical protein ACRRTK_009273 [Alexandromys fortis]